MAKIVIKIKNILKIYQLIYIKTEEITSYWQISLVRLFSPSSIGMCWNQKENKLRLIQHIIIKPNVVVTKQSTNNIQKLKKKKEKVIYP